MGNISLVDWQVQIWVPIGHSYLQCLLDIQMETSSKVHLSVSLSLCVYGWVCGFVCECVCVCDSTGTQKHKGAYLQLILLWILYMEPTVGLSKLWITLTLPGQPGHFSRFRNSDLKEIHDWEQDDRSQNKACLWDRIWDLLNGRYRFKNFQEFSLGRLLQIGGFTVNRLLMN